MVIYSPFITQRLRFIADFIGREMTGQPAAITDNKEDFITNKGPRINYSPARVTVDEVWIAPHTLLFEQGIMQQETACFDWNGPYAFFKTEGDIPFDMLAASFYLLSRYEEYLPYKKDVYGRYAHENALAFREGFLHIPLVNIWLKELEKSLSNKFSLFTIRHLPAGRQGSPFTFIPTYDIDEAYCFKYKQWWRSAGGALKDLLKGDFNRFAQRRRVLNNKEADPFDSYAWIDDLHRPHHLQPRYFFLMAAKTGKYDRNILPSEKALQTLIRSHTEKYSTGIHPSWQSGDDPTHLVSEKQAMERITGTKVVSSRQHFIRFTLPETYRQLIDVGIREDFSMGYGSINGFRASVASPFYWYDLEKEQTTPLMIYPFCYMEANSFFEQKMNPLQALDEMYHYYNEVTKVNGTLITIWHNTFLGTDKLYSGWKEIYTQFMSEVAK